VVEWSWGVGGLGVGGRLIYKELPREVGVPIGSAYKSYLLKVINYPSLMIMILILIDNDYHYLSAN
jgi:hypothetical protein